MQKLQVALLSWWFLDATKLEQGLLENSSLTKKRTTSNGACYTAADGTNVCDTSAVQREGADPQKEKLLNENYQAPEFAWLENRVNSEGYGSINDLKWKVVIIDFWTYSCINCIRTLPYIQKLHETYQDDGLVIIGVHAPEFQFEKDIDNVKEAVKNFGLTYPVVQDNNFMTRRNYDNLYRPAKYIIDKEWRVRYTHFGEGKYEETEEVVQYLLGINEAWVLEEETTTRSARTPETYLWTDRRANYSDSPTDKANVRYRSWKREEDDEKMTLTEWVGSITINAQAKEVNLVLGTENQVIEATIFVDGKEYKKLQISDYQLYNLFTTDVSWVHSVEIRFDQPWVMAYAYTFG